MNATVQGLLTDEVVLEQLLSVSDESPLGKLREILKWGLTKRARLLNTFNMTAFPSQYHTGVQNDAHEYLGLLTDHLKLPGHFVQSRWSIQCIACTNKWEWGGEDLYGLNVLLPLPAPGERRVVELQVQSLVNEYALADEVDAKCDVCASGGAQTQACIKTMSILGEIPVKTLSVCVQRFQFCQEEVEEVNAAGTQQDQGQALSPLSHSASAEEEEEEAAEGGAYDFVLAMWL